MLLDGELLLALSIFFSLFSPNFVFSLLISGFFDRLKRPEKGAFLFIWFCFLYLLFLYPLPVHRPVHADLPTQVQVFSFCFPQSVQ